MPTLLVVWEWLKNYWYLPAFIIGVGLYFLIFRKPNANLVKAVNAEIKAIQAGASAKKLEAALDTEHALAAVKETYVAEMGKLNETQKAKAKELENDPAKLAKFLVRVSSSSPN